MAMDYSQSPRVWTFVSFLCLSVLVSLTARHYYDIWKRKKLLEVLPQAEVKNNDWKAALFQASSENPKNPFVIHTGARPRVILPNHVMDDVRRLPENQLSPRKDLFDKMHGRWTEIGADHVVGIKAIQKELTSNVALLLPDLQDEAKYAIDQHFGSALDWTPIALFPHLLQVSALTNSRFFVGPLARSQEWRDLSMAYALDIHESVRTIETWPRLLRGLVVPFLKPLRRLASHKVRADYMLRPHIAAALDIRNGEQGDKKIEGPGLNLMTWMLNYVDTRRKIDTGYLAREQLFIGSGSIHSTALTITNILYDLASHPEYVPELRAEIEDTLASEPGSIMRKNSLPKLRKLDSLLLESQRMNPVALTSIHRRVTAHNGIRLSTGHTLPYDTAIGFLHALAPWSSPPADLIASNAEQPPLTTFYPFRYSELRSRQGEEGYHQFTQTGRDNINFGHGPGSCPGRWFASAELKVIMIELLRRYDFALGPHGEGEGVNTSNEESSYSRPKPVILPGSLQIMPDFKAAIYLKERREDDRGKGLEKIEEQTHEFASQNS